MVFSIVPSKLCLGTNGLCFSLSSMVGSFTAAFTVVTITGFSATAPSAAATTVASLCFLAFIAFKMLSASRGFGSSLTAGFGCAGLPSS